MKDETRYELAKAICISAHKGQTDKAGAYLMS